MARSRPARPVPALEVREARADALKERIYLTFTAIAVLISMLSHRAPTAGEAARTLLITAAGMLLAIFVADVISHLVAHERFMTRAELRAAASVSLGAFTALALPFLFLGAAGLGWWTPTSAIRGSIVALIVTLVLIGWVAIRRVPLHFWQRVVVLAAEAALGTAVVVLESLAHH